MIFVPFSLSPNSNARFKDPFTSPNSFSRLVLPCFCICLYTIAHLIQFFFFFFFFHFSGIIQVTKCNSYSWENCNLVGDIHFIKKVGRVDVARFPHVLGQDTLAWLWD
ncbi:hypothetical protein NL108_017830 [Boleophthalmus pectinirostris]|nr:hypothetical protein NL108_017830 [Boleophthalmus pectinirostris]